MVLWVDLTPEKWTCEKCSSAGRKSRTNEEKQIQRRADYWNPEGGAGGRRSEAVCAKHNISEPTYYTWKRKYGGLEVSTVAEI